MKRAATVCFGGGAIVNISSAFGVVGMSGTPIYVASKHAAIGLTKATALKFATRNIRVNAVLPGGVETEMLTRFERGVSGARDYLSGLHPMDRVGTPEEIASAVLWLCAPSASFVTGQCIAVDEGLTAR